MPTLGKKGCCEEEAQASLRCPYDDKVADLLQQHSYNFVLTDPRLPHNPIVFASEGFCEMCGYTREEILGRNCKFLQGPDTDAGTVSKIRAAILEERPCQVKILNYTKQGKAFWNLFHMAPIYSRDDGRVIHFVGVQTPINPDLADQTPENMEVPARSSSMASACEALSELGDLAGPSLQEAQQKMGSSVASTIESDREDVEPPEFLKQKAKKAVDNVVEDLKRCSDGKAGSCAEVKLSESAAAGVVCSSLMLSLTRIQQSFVLADPNLPDMPIIHASSVFCQLTGYSREEVVGRNCRFLQGEGTDSEAVKELRESIAAERPCTVRLLNYRKDGQPFYNSLHVAPVRNNAGKVVYYIGVQLDVTAADGSVAQDKGMSQRLKQLGAVGAVRVAVRSLQGSGLRRPEVPVVQNV